jgi:hypothetical protein
MPAVSDGKFFLLRAFMQTAQNLSQVKQRESEFHKHSGTAQADKLHS